MRLGLVVCVYVTFVLGCRTALFIVLPPCAVCPSLLREDIGSHTVLLLLEAGYDVVVADNLVNSRYATLAR